MPQPNKTSTLSAPGWEPVNTTGWETVSPPKPQEDFTSNPKGEGLYTMVEPGKGLVKVPYSKVMDAYHAGYRIDPEDQRRYAEDRLYQIQQQDKKNGTKTTTTLSTVDTPEAFRVMSSPPATFSPDWWRGKGADVLNLLPTAGSIVGGLISGVGGAETGPGDLFVASAGAGAGGTGGEALRQEGMKILYPFAKPMSAKESAEKIAEQGAMGALSEAGGRVVGKKLLNPAMRYFGRTAEASEKAGFPMLPSEASRKAPSYVERYLKGSLFSSGKMEAWRDLQNTQTKAAVNRIADAISSFQGNREELGKLVQSGIEQHKVEFRALQSQMYKDIDDMVQREVIQEPVQTSRLSSILDEHGNPIPITETTMKDKVVDKVMPSTAKLKEFAAEELQKINEEEQVLSPSLLSRSRELLQTIIDSPDHVTYRAMANARSDALDAVRQFSDGLAGKEEGLAKKLASLYDESMMTAAKNSGIEGLPEAVEKANGLTASEHAKFEQKLVDRIIKTKNPETIAAVIRSAQIGNQETRDLFSILPEDMHQPVQKHVILNILKQTTDPISKVFNERKFAEQIGKLGEDRGSIIFGKNWKNIEEITSYLERINGVAGLGGGSTGAGLKNASIISTILASPAGALAGITEGVKYGGSPELWGPIGAAVGALLGLGGSAVAFRTAADAMTHPETAVMMIKLLKAIIHYGSFAPTAGYNLYQGSKERDELRKEGILRSPNKVQVTTPDGQIHVFPNAKAAEAFKRDVGVQ